MKVDISLVLLALGIKVRCESFDYVIAGAGTCGLVLANRLSEELNIRVAVIEPGGDVRHNPNVTDVTRFLRAFGTDIDWQYTTTPQPGASNRSLAYHAGRAIGGTSTINGMTYIRGDKAEFDALEALGNKGWNWDTLYSYFKRVERFSPPTAAQTSEGGASFNPEYHGEDGPLTTGFPFELLNGSFHELAREAWQKLGYPLNPDVNSGETRGFDVWPQTLDRDADIREDAARAYYYPIEQRPNLKIIKGTVTKLTWANSSTAGSLLSADGVEYRDSNNKTATLSATKEVVLSAGALRTPLILESSGVGNPEILKKYGIETKIELNGVGENLQDQPNTALEYSSNFNVTGTAPYATFVTAQDIFGNQTSTVAAATDAKLSEWAQRVSDVNGGAISPSQLERIFRVQHNLIFNKNVTIAESLTSGSGSILISAFWTLLPFSRGSVHIKSAEDIEDPIIDPKYLFIDFDLTVQAGIGRTSQGLWYTEPISNTVVSYLVPGDADLPRNASDAQWAAALGPLVSPNHHALGTASMMSRELGGVVDPKLKVFGTSNVRVVDASVLPMQISGHLTATLYAVAERAAELIKNS
ncbi:putative GMC oxidoreductase [Annulohypoxylon truncatum]|uniref:putative GMC oxidoreductase n=1 Tax=Annulohypoxylon truncatum TaxID=327061 RepID=UPI002008218C|nr:putative GMC oxidoreductase [Annulohypoxylon truncatum]KAI1213531.1 putative GMC oxidoreductase [Annulohypoxylon truncatum]